MKHGRVVLKGNSLPNLYLVGFMGTGKSSMGKRLAARFNLRFIDSDEEIEKSSGMSIKDIFAKFGEEKFREMERDFIENGHPKTGCVVSCGGGLVCRDGMPELVKSKGVSIVLFAEPEVIFKRVSLSKTRPLLNVENPMQRICELLDKRSKYYNRSGICVSSSGNPNDVEERLARIYAGRVKNMLKRGQD
ncbi:shikimate kinase [Intestinicryptomonas porci]|uniref:Shikimate kinase n=1 Tax=Intestinicryptomonas porci TaxID=2926320 RepID=A0ABU4WJA0_9BACT|nr:shikimate kinase [Opitutales bacterium CLA-KB-P66]